MVAPVLISSTPVDGADNVPTNLELILEFSTPILSTSVDGAVQLKDLDTGQTYPVTLGVDANEVTVYVGRALEDYTRFEIRIFGADLAAVATPIKSSTGDSMLVTTVISFMTALPVVIGSVSTDDTFSETVVDASGSTVVATYALFDLEATTPEDATLYIDPGYFNPDASGNPNNPVIFDFNLDIDPVSASGAIVVEQRAFGERRFSVSQAADIEALGDGQFLAPSGQVYSPSNISTFDHPNFTFTIVDDKLSVYFSDTDGVRWNSQIRVTVKSTLKSTVATGAQTLGADHTVLFTTGMFPWFAEIEQIRLELGESNENFTDFLISRYIFRDSVRAWRLACFTFDITEPSWFINDYVVKRTLYDLFTGPEGVGKLGSAKSKSLGDFSVRYNSGGNIDTKELIKQMRNELAELEKWLKYRCAGSGGYGELATAVKGVLRTDYPPLHFRERHWHRESLGDTFRPGIENSHLDRAPKNPRVNEQYYPIYSSRWGNTSYEYWSDTRND